MAFFDSNCTLPTADWDSRLQHGQAAALLNNEGKKSRQIMTGFDV